MIVVLKMSGEVLKMSGEVLKMSGEVLKMSGEVLKMSGEESPSRIYMPLKKQVTVNY